MPGNTPPTHTTSKHASLVLIVEDDPGQARLIQMSLASLEHAPFMCEIAETLADAWTAMEAKPVAAVLLDLTLPDSSGASTLEKTHAKHPDIPIVVLTGIEDEKLGLQLVHAGAQDYLPKGQVTPALLARTITYAIERKQTAVERERLLADLRAALAEVKTLTGLIPICASCKKVRNDQGYWDQVESYIAARTQASFSHGICPDCAKKLYPGFNLYPAGQERSAVNSTIPND